MFAIGQYPVHPNLDDQYVTCWGHPQDCHITAVSPRNFQSVHLLIHWRSNKQCFFKMGSLLTEGGLFRFFLGPRGPFCLAWKICRVAIREMLRIIPQRGWDWHHQRRVYLRRGSGSNNEPNLKSYVVNHQTATCYGCSLACEVMHWNIWNKFALQLFKIPLEGWVSDNTVPFSIWLYVFMNI